MILFSFQAANKPRYRNVALLICHLFIRGQFRQGHILYDPKAFDGHLTAEVDLVCPVPIPWQLTDITQPSPSPPTKGDNTTRTDHILQLIFFDPKYLAEQIEENKGYLTFYRIFILPSTNDHVGTKNRIFTIRKSNSISDSNALTLYYNFKTNLVYVCLASDNIQIDGCDDVFNEHDLIDQTFGKYDRMRSIAIQFQLTFWNMTEKTDLKSAIPVAGHRYFANYFLSAFNSSYINVSCQGLNTPTESAKRQIFMRKQSKRHNALSLNYEWIGDGQSNGLMQEQTDALYFTSYLLSARNDKRTSIYPLYPYQSHKVSVFFIYGADFQRQPNIWMVAGSDYTILIFIGIFVCLASVVLLVIRLKFNLYPNSLMATFIDTMVAFIAGGNLRMRHKWERLFFGILLIDAFFITSLFTGNLLDCVILILNQKMETFKQLADLTSPIFVHSAIAKDVELVRTILEREIGPNIDFKGVSGIRKLVSTHKNSLIYVAKENNIELITALLMGHQREFDVLEEDLGDITTRFYLESNQLVSDRVLKKIDRATSLMMENGLHRFYTSITAFQRKLFIRAFSQQEDDDMQALTVEQLTIPMNLVLRLFGIATVIFAFEILIFKFRCWITRLRE